ncbi:MAG: UPF0175 family protein [Candidatus Hodarchaeota archaeon]
MLKNIATRISKELEKDIESFMKDKGLDKSSAVRKILEMGLNEWKKKKAIELFSLKRVTLWKASEIAGISLREMMDELNKQKIPIHVSIRDIEEDIKAAKEAET